MYVYEYMRIGYILRKNTYIHMLLLGAHFHKATHVFPTDGLMERYTNRENSFYEAP